jgi:hypothetical protein
LNQPLPGSEAEIKRAIREALGTLPDVRVFVNNVGHALNTESGQHVDFGLIKGASDLIGVGPGGRFLALEVKSLRGKPSPEQVAFIAMVRRLGGIAGVVRSPGEALALIAAARIGQ